MGPGVLSQLLSCLPRIADERLVVGFDGADDAAVYLIDAHTALIQTVDFFPPMVDDPFTFGQVAAANALSDIYAMGAVPKLAMNLLCLPSCLPESAARAILEGGADKAREAGVVIAGGHSIEDKEPKYGMCVTGFAHPDEILTNRGARAGDRLILTKPIGSGVLTTAARADLLTAEELSAVTEVMTALNRTACEVMRQLRPSACTDVTGFGLLGHLREMALGSGVAARIWSAEVPILPRAPALAREGIVPGGAYRNRAHLEGFAAFAPSVPLEVTDLLFDPQTSGGLLIAIAPARAEELIHRLLDAGVAAAVVGECFADTPHIDVE